MTSTVDYTKAKSNDGFVVSQCNHRELTFRCTGNVKEWFTILDAIENHQCVGSISYGNQEVEVDESNGFSLLDYVSEKCPKGFDALLVSIN